MTNDEAVKRLQSLKLHCAEMREEYGDIWSEDVEALEYAIKRLEE